MRCQGEQRIPGLVLQSSAEASAASHELARRRTMPAGKPARPFPLAVISHHSCVTSALAGERTPDF